MATHELVPTAQRLSRKHEEVPSTEGRARALALLRRYGRDTTSFQVLESEYRYFFVEDGFVAYVDTGSAWVAGGGPIAPPSRVASVVRDFQRAANVAKRRASFFAVTEDFLRATKLPHVHVGKQPFWHPEDWPDTVASTSSLRYQIRRAEKKGVSVRFVRDSELVRHDPLRSELDRLVGRWTETRRLAPMGFLVALEPHVFSEEHVYLVAEHDRRVVGFLSAVPIYARSGWLIEDLLRDREAPNGTVELLVDRAMRFFAERTNGPVTLGLAPLAGDVSKRLRVVRTVAQPLFDFRGLHAFKSKLRPSYWEDVHVAAAPSHSAWVALFDGLVAFAHGDILSFGIDTLKRSRGLLGGERAEIDA